MDRFPEGLPCVGCGYCCLKTQCILSVEMYGPQETCPALSWNGLRHVCEHAKTHETDLAIGAGCCASLFNSWRDDIHDRISEPKYWKYPYGETKDKQEAENDT